MRHIVGIHRGIPLPTAVGEAHILPKIVHQAGFGYCTWCKNTVPEMALYTGPVLQGISEFPAPKRIFAAHPDNAEKKWCTGEEVVGG